MNTDSALPHANTTTDTITDIPTDASAAHCPLPGSPPVRSAVSSPSTSFVGLAGPPRQLPLASPWWVNRATELATCDRLAQRDGTALILVIGAGGVGKTAMALHWLGHHADPDGTRYPDGTLYVDMAGWSDQPPPAPEQVLAGWLRALGVPLNEVGGRAELEGIFRTVTATRALSILIDNVADPALITPLLPTSPQCVVVVTSRRRLSRLLLSGFTPIRLDGLTTANSVTLLGNIPTQEPDQPEPDQLEADELEALAQHCHGLPLALVIIRSYLTVHTGHTPADLLTRLHTTSGAGLTLGLDNVSVGAVLDVSYQRLDPEHAYVYRLCGLHPGVDIAAASLAAAGIGHDSAERCLRGLADVHLIEEPRAGRFRFHDLVRTHAAALARQHDPPDERDRTVRRIIEWHLRRMAAADYVLNPHAPRFGPAYQPTSTLKSTVDSTPPFDDAFDDAKAAGDWFEQARPTILACQEIAQNRGWDDVACQLAETLWNALRRNDSADTLRHAQQLGVDAARRWAQDLDPASPQEALPHRQPGQRPASSSDAATDTASDAVSIARLLEAICQFRVAYAETNRSRHPQAIAAATAAVELATSMGHEWTLSAALSTRGRAHLAADQPRHALRDLHASLELAHRCNSPRGIALRHRRIGAALAHRDIADYTSALVHLRRAGELMRSSTDHIGNARVANEIAAILIHQGKPRAALEELNEVSAAVHTDGSPLYRADLYAGYALAYTALNAIPTARQWFTDAIALYDAAGHTTTRQYRDLVAARDTLHTPP